MNERHLAALALLAVSATGAGCSNGALIGFDIPKSIDEQRITGNAAANAAGMALPAGSLAPMAISVDLAAESSTRRIPIGRVLLKSFKLDITATGEEGGDTDDFSFIRSATLFFECTAPGCSLPRVQVGSVASPGAVRTLNFSITPGVNIKPYIDSGVRVSIEADAIPPPDDTTFNGQVVLRVEPI
jgi:hypothetical protein